MAKKKNKNKKNKNKGTGGASKRPQVLSQNADDQPTDPMAPEEVQKVVAAAAASTAPPTRAPAPSLRPVPMALIAILCVIGAAISVYMTWHHELAKYGAEGAFGEVWGCAEAEGVSCDIVNTSSWSTFLGVPQFTWGIVAYLTMLGLTAWALFKDRSAAWLLLGVGLWSLIYSLFLAYISKVELGTWCLWCIRLYGINFAIPLFAVSGRAWRMPKPQAATFGAAAGMFVVSALIGVGAQQAYHASLLSGGGEIEALPEVVADTIEKDEAGPAPVLTWEVTTEKGEPATLSTAATDAWKGNKDSKVAVVEFADFECGYCKRMSGELKRLYEAYADRVVFIYKHYPMDPTCNPGVNNKRHRRACMAAEASICAQDQGVFWPFHDLAFKNQHQLRAEDLTAYATKAGVDVGQFQACMRSGEGKERIRADGEMGKALQTGGTPRIWVNGKLYRAGQSAELMARDLELALGATAADAAASAKEMRITAPAAAPIPDDVPPMQKIQLHGTTFEIDTFEASVDAGKATVGKHQVPGTRMSWFAAKDACEAAGKRLCTEEEWVAACQGADPVDDDGDGQFADDMVEGTTYPYGDYHTPRLCWDARNKETERPVYTGELPGCVSKDGVYDLTGNMEEWVGTSEQTAVLLGGAFDTSKDHARCFRRNDTFGPGYANKRTGFRCCR